MAGNEKKHLFKELFSIDFAFPIYYNKIAL